MEIVQVVKLMNMVSDPRCQPYCSSDICQYPYDHDYNGNIITMIILICLMAIFFIIWFVYGPQLFEEHDDHERANVLVPVEMMKNK